MQVLAKLLLLTLLVMLTSYTSVAGKGLYYSNRPGQPSNIHYIERKPASRGGSCQDNCRTAEIIKVPLRNHSSDCPQNQKKDARGRCRAYWN